MNTKTTIKKKGGKSGKKKQPGEKGKGKKMEEKKDLPEKGKKIENKIPDNNKPLMKKK